MSKDVLIKVFSSENEDPNDSGDYNTFEMVWWVDKVPDPKFNKALKELLERLNK
jgi:hypothetical protein